MGLYQILAPSLLAALLVSSAGCTAKAASPAVEPPTLVSNTAAIATAPEVAEAEPLDGTIAVGRFVRVVDIHHEDGFAADVSEIQGSVCIVLERDEPDGMTTTIEGYYAGALGCDTNSGTRYYFYAVALEAATGADFDGDPSQFDETD